VERRVKWRMISISLSSGSRPGLAMGIAEEGGGIDGGDVERGSL
jgi:hypothetical protein